MEILNVSEIAYNDQHNYYGGAIGNIAYNLVSHLTEHDGVSFTSYTTGADIQNSLPERLRLVEEGSYSEIESSIEDELNERTPDILTHLYFHEPLHNPILTGREFDCPVVIGMCERPHPRLRDEVSGIQQFKLLRAVGKRFLMPRFKRTLQACDRLVVVDEAAKEYYSEFIQPGEIDVIPYGVDLERFSYEPIPQGRRILMVNRLIKRRGVRHMLDALETVTKEIDAVELHVVGAGPQRDALTKRAKQSGVRSAITFHGNVGPDRLAQLYHSSTVFSHLSYADGWNQPALEAMASGRPVITTEAPHNSMIREGVNGYRVPWNDPDAVADRLLNLLTTPRKAREMGRRGREIAEQEYDWEDIANQYYDLLSEKIRAY